MSTVEYANAGYNVRHLKVHKRRNRLRAFGKVIMILLPLCISLVFLFNYLARLPRERFAKRMGYWERVKLGGTKAFYSTYLTLSADEPNPKETRLPIFELYIKGKKLDKLVSNLPDSGKEYQSARIKVGGKEFKAEARLRGDSLNHWVFPNKSWRVYLAKDKFYEDMKEINLNVPRVETQIANWIGYEMGRRFDHLLVPFAQNVHFRLNRVFDGVRLLLEQPNQDFLRRRNLSPGKIFVGDIDTAQIYGNVPRKKLYQDPSGWSVRGPDDNVGLSEIEELIKVINSEHNPYAFLYKMRELVDLDAITEYMALLELVGSVHVDETHNGKYYLDPTNGRFVPIVWDTVAYLWKNTRESDLAPNGLFRVLLSNPGIREQKDRTLYRALKGDLSAERLKRMISQQVDDVRADVRAFALKLHANDKGLRHISNSEWDSAIAELLKVVDQRHNYLEQRLTDSLAAYRLEQRSDRTLLGVEVRSRSGAELKTLKLQLDKPVTGREVVLSRWGISDLGIPVSEEVSVLRSKSDAGIVTFQVDDTLYSKRRFDRRKTVSVVPGSYVYELKVTGGAARVAKVLELGMNNSVTGTSFTPVEEVSMVIPDSYKVNSVWWDPDKFAQKHTRVLSGRVELTEDLILDPYTTLEVAPGTTVRLGEKVSIVVGRGGMKAVGTAQRPIRFEGLSDLPWGVIGVKEGEATLQHVSVVGGSEKIINRVRYQGSLNVHHGKLTLTDSSVVDNYVTARNAEIDLSRVSFNNIFDESIIAENSVVHQNAVKKIGHPALHTAALRSSQAFGTPPRLEREFKFSLTGSGVSRYSLSELSDEILEALKATMQTSDVWSAPKFTGTNYFVDQGVKDFVFRDVYFDTADRLNFQHGVSYRLRNRYSSIKGYEYHTKKPFWSEVWPHRVEFQAKTERQEETAGFSTVMETRFEFRKESAPFSEQNLPPPSPWDLDEFIPYFKAGNFKGLTTLPAQVVYNFHVPEHTSKTELEFEPVTVVVTERFRQHLNIKSPWGSGPNPEQSYIITLDQSHVYEAKQYLEYLHARKLGVKHITEPVSTGRLLEIEIEFERNVSDKLDQAILKAESNGDGNEAQKLKEARDAFLKDQGQIVSVIQDYFKDKGVVVAPASKSKYVQAVELL